MGNQLLFSPYTLLLPITPDFTFATPLDGAHNINLFH